MLELPAKYDNNFALVQKQLLLLSDSIQQALPCVKQVISLCTYGKQWIHKLVGESNGKHCIATHAV